MKEDFEEIFAYQDDRKATVDVREAAEILGLHPNTVYKGALYRFVCGRE